MGFFKQSPEEIAAKEAQRQHQEEIERRRAELETPAGQAKAARDDGAKTFQISLPLSKTIGEKGIWLGGSSTTTKTEHSSVIDSIEAQGWKLEHASYVYQITKTVSSRSVFSGSAQGYDQAYDGEIIGIYIFRINE
jgi:hypothetical protein